MHAFNSASLAPSVSEVLFCSLTIVVLTLTFSQTTILQIAHMELHLVNSIHDMTIENPIITTVVGMMRDKEEHFCVNSVNN